MNINILFLYPNMLDLYGDNKNIDILKYRALKRGIEISIDTYTIGDSKPNFSKYDLVFLSPSGKVEKKIITEDLIKYKSDIKKSVESGVFYLLIADGYQLFGEYYIDNLGEKTNCLDIFKYYSKDTNNKCVGDVVIESEIGKQKVKLLGFENHSYETFNVETPFGKVLYGNGNSYNSGYEGFMIKSVIGTYLHGPLLSKNPELADYILKYCLDRKNNKKTELKKIDDEFEIIAKKEMLDKLLKTSSI